MGRHYIRNTRLGPRFSSWRERASYLRQNDGTAERTPLPKDLKCDVCGKAYALLCPLLKHEQAKHTPEELAEARKVVAENLKKDPPREDV